MTVADHLNAHIMEIVDSPDPTYVFAIGGDEMPWDRGGKGYLVRRSRTGTCVECPNETVAFAVARRVSLRTGTGTTGGVRPIDIEF